MEDIIILFLHVVGLATNIQGIFLNQVKKKQHNVVMLPLFEDR